MPANKKKLSPRDKEYRRKTSRDKDILGCYKKNMKNGTYVCSMAFHDVPVRLRRRFRAAVLMNGDTNTRAVQLFFEQYAAAVEKKFNIHLDPEWPEGYDPT